MTRDPTTVAYYHAPPPRRFQRWTAGFRPLPDFLILGAQKAGTTSLHRYLELHPSVLKPRVKEVHFFDEERAWARGPGSRPGPRARAQGPGPRALGLGPLRRKKNVRDGRRARIDPPRQVIMTKPIFVLRNT